MHNYSRKRCLTEVTASRNIHDAVSASMRAGGRPARIGVAAIALGIVVVGSSMGCQSSPAYGDVRTVFDQPSSAEPPKQEMAGNKERQKPRPKPDTSRTGEVMPVSKAMSESQTGNMPTTIPIIEEELHVGKRRVESGKTKIILNSIDTPVKESIRLKTEKILIERVPAANTVAARDFTADQRSFEPRTIELVEMAEVPVVSIRPEVTAMVTIRKEERVGEQKVQERVRETKVDVLREPKTVPSQLDSMAAAQRRENDPELVNRLSLPSQQDLASSATVAEVKQRLTVGKRMVPDEVVRLRITPVEHVVEQAVQLREEHIVIERKPVSRSVSELPNGTFAPQSIEITTMKEVPVLSKQAKVKELLTIKKDVGEQERTVQANLQETQIALTPPADSQ